jgi:hypothetical protein
VTVKRITFVRRADGVAPEGFAERWRDRALSLHDAAPDGARVRRLVHCVVRPGRREGSYHGAAIEWFDDEANRSRHDELAVQATDDALIDGAATETTLVEERTVCGQDLLESWWRAGTREPRLLLLGIIQRKPELSRTQFRDYWWDEHRPLANRMLPLDVQPPIYVHNYALPGEACAWDGVGEFYDLSMEVARRRTAWAASEPAEAIAIDEGRFLVRESRAALVTDAEVVIADPPAPAAAHS